MNPTRALTKEEKKSFIIRTLKQNGCRITNQRRLLIDIILEDECCCCKEMYYQALEKDPTIGMATVYRMVKTLEETGLIHRKNMYRISCEYADRCEDPCASQYGKSPREKYASA
ncbi:Fe2+/Zn2+ uptake regulation protein [Clostridium sp. MCC353]|uniref:transcriptional repressor n=1 Tax=Clostridium sp. MCC353 TaxID=2592646 RepID=UPI001C00B8E7|nr:transcriptional repressor [Clostridium sp. MCC353]MBT9777616.1 Fe2+/Zn2+ uptake regulation protein [Clostridium sp. MCC353]